MKLTKAKSEPKQSKTVVCAALNKNIIELCATTYQPSQINSIQTVEECFRDLNPTTEIEQMLAAQMLTIHHLQQTTIATLNKTDHFRSKEYYLNAAIKLTNAFSQQAGLLAKLQGKAGQKNTIEQVNIHLPQNGHNHKE